MIIVPDTGEIIKAYIFVGVMTYSQYAYVEAFLDMKQRSWINAHVHMYEFFGGVARILVPDNCKTAVVHNGGWKDQQLNETYQELAEHYGTAIIPARVRTPKDKPNAEGTVGNISTWITAALRNEQSFSLNELNHAIHGKLNQFNRKLFQKKEGSRLSLISGCHREDIKGVGVYFLMCQEDDGTDSVYIGEAENVLQRVWSVGKRICQRRRIYCFGRINCVGLYHAFFGNRRKGLFQS